MKHIIIFILSLANFAVYSQEVIIDTDIMTEKTSIKTSGYTFQTVPEIILINDTLKLVFAKSGLGGKALIINISNKITPEIILWSDSPSFDGKRSKSIPLESYKMTFNRNKYNNGDLLMAKIECISKPFKPYTGNPIFKYVGDIRQIIKVK